MEENVKILGSTSKTKNQLKNPPIKFNFPAYQLFPQNLSDLYVLLCTEVHNSFRAGQLHIQINSASGNLQTIV